MDELIAGKGSAWMMLKIHGKKHGQSLDAPSRMPQIIKSSGTSLP
jgi:hypothetical protein